jgi:uncharacterized protein YggU (UPF0235/DUF167 family)
MGACFRARGDGTELFVRLTPKSSRDAVEGIETAADGSERLKVRVRAVPEDGAANRAATLVVAKWLGVPKSAVTLAAGSTSRSKTFYVALHPEKVAQAAALLTGSAR